MAGRSEELLHRSPKGVEPEAEHNKAEPLRDGKYELTVRDRGTDILINM